MRCIAATAPPTYMPAFERMLRFAARFLLRQRTSLASLNGITKEQTTLIKPENNRMNVYRRVEQIPLYLLASRHEKGRCC